MEMTSDKNLMTEGSYKRKIIIFALPVFFGNLFQQLYNAADSLIVGNFVGSNALAAVTSAGNLIFLVVGFFQGLAVGAGVVIARYIGARDNANTEKAVHTTVLLGLVSSVIMTVAGIALAPAVLKLMSTPDNVMADSVLYFRVYFAGSTGLVMYNTFVGILQAAGDSRHPLYYLIISSIFNVVLDLVLIAGFGMGVGAAAFATAASQLLSAVMSMIRLMRSRTAYRLSLKKLRFDIPILEKIIKFGLPSGLQNSIIGLSNVVIQSFINSFGSMAMAGIGAYCKVEGFAFLPVNSFAMALTTFVGQNMGAGKSDRARKGSTFGILCTVIMAEIIGIVLWLTAPSVIALFDRTPEVIAYGNGRARVCCLFYCLVAFSHIMAAVMRGAGKAVTPMMVMLICWCVVRLTVLAFASIYFHSIEVTYWIYPFTWTISTIVFAFEYKKMTFKM